MSCCKNGDAALLPSSEGRYVTFCSGLTATSPTHRGFRSLHVPQQTYTSVYSFMPRRCVKQILKMHRRLPEPAQMEVGDGDELAQRDERCTSSKGRRALCLCLCLDACASTPSLRLQPRSGGVLCTSRCATCRGRGGGRGGQKSQVRLLVTGGRGETCTLWPEAAAKLSRKGDGSCFSGRDDSCIRPF